MKVRDRYQAAGHDNVYAVGIAAAVDVPWQTATPVGVPKTGFPTERMAHVAARNIAARIRGEPASSHEAFGDMPAVCVMDAGNNGVIGYLTCLFIPKRGLGRRSTAEPGLRVRKPAVLRQTGGAHRGL